MFSKIKSGLVNSLDDVFHLVSANSCAVCEKEIIKNWEGICSFCLNEMPYTLFEKYIDDSQLDKLFWGRVKIHATYSLLYFEKKGPVQSVLHRIKYKNDRKLTIKMGKMIGKKLIDSPKFADLDALLPVPLHFQKFFLRGYNQSEILADGIAEAMNLRLDIQSLIRTKNTQTQTKKNRFQRWDNVDTKFVISENNNLSQYKHIALIDDVITTGATLETIVREIQSHAPELKISIISLALTK